MKKRGIGKVADAGDCSPTVGIDVRLILNFAVVFYSFSVSAMYSQFDGQVARK
jgi:hypothetical protein